MNSSGEHKDKHPAKAADKLLEAQVEQEMQEMDTLLRDMTDPSQVKKPQKNFLRN